MRGRWSRASPGRRAKMVRTVILAHDLTFVRGVCVYRLPTQNLLDVHSTSCDTSRHPPPLTDIARCNRKHHLMSIGPASDRSLFTRGGHISA